MSVAIEGNNSFFIGSRAVLLDESRDTASSWASEYVKPNPAVKWVLGKYIEADKANNNKQYWYFDDLKAAQPTIDHAPMNLNHQARNIVGAYVATEMMYPAAEAKAAGYQSTDNPYIEALGVVWSYYFPEETKVIQEAHDTGNLFYSMECVAETITCGGDFGCDATFEYAGRISETYCAHLNEHLSWKILNNPHFLAGALIVPPEKPGWNGAEIKELAKAVEAEAEQAEAIYASLAQEFPEQGHFEWEQKMLSLMARAHLGTIL